MLLDLFTSNEEGATIKHIDAHGDFWYFNQIFPRLPCFWGCMNTINQDHAIIM